VRATKEHAVAVFQKSELRGRAEFAAFFLEDPILPTGATQASTERQSGDQVTGDRAAEDSAATTHMPSPDTAPPSSPNGDAPEGANRHVEISASPTVGAGKAAANASTKC
jgi:hypothetical protein